MADLVVVKGKPEDMKALLTSVAVVMQGGKVVRNDLKQSSREGGVR